MSAVLPEIATNEPEEVVYVVGMLRSAGPATCRTAGCLEELVRQNERIAEAAAAIGAKQYLANHSGEEGWRRHFGGKWDRFVARKFEYDPMAILGPGQGIFERRYGFENHLGPLTREPI